MIYPEQIYPLPEGAVLLGRGGEFDTGGKTFDGWVIDADFRTLKRYIDGYGLYGHNENLIYAAPANSEIVKLNNSIKEVHDAMEQARDGIAKAMNTKKKDE